MMKFRARRIDERRAHFLYALRELDDAWVEAFHRTGFGDVYFSRLFTELWLLGDGAVAKSDAYSLVHGVSAQTAMKYLRQAITEGYLEEIDNPDDRRSHLIRMSPRLRGVFNEFIDRARDGFEAAFLPRKRKGVGA